MFLRNTNLECIKLIELDSKKAHKKKVTEIFKEFFEDIKGTIKGLKGYAILENIEIIEKLLF